MNFAIYILKNKIEDFYIQAIREYEKRLKRYCKISFNLVNPIDDKILKRISNSYSFFVTNKGKSFSSESLSEKINSLGINGVSHISIILGKTDILTDKKISLSQVDMCEGLQSVIMFEQIYRSYKIISNEPYHR